jgi:hypothetical protein
LFREQSLYTAPLLLLLVPHVGTPLLKNTVVATFEQHVNIRTDCMYIIYAKPRMNMHMHVNMCENQYKVRITYNVQHVQGHLQHVMLCVLYHASRCSLQVTNKQYEAQGVAYTFPGTGSCPAEMVVSPIKIIVSCTNCASEKACRYMAVSTRHNDYVVPGYHHMFLPKPSIFHNFLTVSRSGTITVASGIIFSFRTHPVSSRNSRS